MCKLMILVLAALWNTGWTHSSKQWHRAISALKGESPSLRSILDFQIPPDTNFLTIPPDSLEHLNYLLRVVYIPEQSPMKHILRGVDIPDLYEINQVLNYDGFWNEINANPERYSRMFADYVARQYQRQDLRAMKLMSQEEQEYQECAKDYDSFIAPITNLLSQILFNPCDEEEGGSPLPCINGTLPSFKMYRDGWKMIDAMFKIPEAIIEGKLHWPAAYDYCNEIEASYEYNASDTLEDRQYTGKYARLHLTFLGLIERNISLSLILGVCAPSTCTEEHIKQYLTEDNILIAFIIEQILRMGITQVFQGRVHNTSSDSLLQFTLFVLCVLLVCIVTSTLYDGFFRKDIMHRGLEEIAQHYNKNLRLTNEPITDDTPPPDSKRMLRRLSSIASVTSQSDLMSLDQLTKMDESDPPRWPLTWRQRLEMVFVSFSAYSNSKRIFTLDYDSSYLGVIDGLKMFTYGWCIIGQTAVIGIGFAEIWTTQNLLAQVRRWPKLVSFQFVLDFFISADNFLMFSGILMSYHWLKKLDRKKFSVMFALKFYCKKLWVLWVPLAFTMLFYTALMPYWPDGPFVPAENSFDAAHCHSTWWAPLLFINNFVTRQDACMSWTSHFAILVQLHLAALVVLIPLSLKVKFQRIPIFPCGAYVILALLFLVHLIVTGTITRSMYGRDGSWLEDYFMMPWCRAGPYLIGMAVGIVLYHHKFKGFQIKLADLPRMCVSWAGMVGASACCLFSVFITHVMHKEGGETWDRTNMAAYNTLAPNLMAIGVSWIVLASVMGYGIGIADILQMKLWRPYVRLMYQAYLVSAVVSIGYFYMRRTTLYLSLYSLLYQAVVNLLMTIFLGFIAALLWQYPITYRLKEAVVCKDVFSWIRFGKHPKATLQTLKCNLTAKA